MEEEFVCINKVSSVFTFPAGYRRAMSSQGMDGGGGASLVLMIISITDHLLPNLRGISVMSKILCTCRNCSKSGEKKYVAKNCLG